MFLVLLCVLGFEEIANGMQPKQIKNLTFTETLRFGSAANDDDAYLWAGADTNLAVDKAGNIYVADTDEARIIMFDQNGKLVRILAGKGQGPGELVSLQSFHILSDGRGIAQERLQMRAPNTHLFDQSLAFQRRIAPDGEVKFLSWAMPAPKGDALLVQYLTFNETFTKQQRHVALLDMDYKQLHAYSLEEQDMQMRRMREPAYFKDFLAESLQHEFEPRAVVNFDARGRIYWAISTEYKVNIQEVGSDTPLRVVTREYKPFPNKPGHARAMLDRIADRYRGIQVLADILTPSFLEMVVSKAELPPAHKPVYGIIPMDKGFLVVHAIDFESGAQTADIFGETGQYQGSVTLPDWAFLAPDGYPRMLFRNGFAYTVLTDEEGENSVVRYAVVGK